jgi:S-adenosylmethionine hydrolase
MTSPNIVIISDYGTGDPAFTEVMLQIKLLLPNAYIMPQATPAFSTLNTGFWIYQISLAPNIKNTYIFSNTAPRKEDKKAQSNNGGEKLMYAKLSNGFEIIAVNAGYAFSFVKPNIKEFRYVNVENEGSQFRSRDYYPKAVAQMVEKNKEFIGEKGDLSSIPNVPKNKIASIDGYGNIKTTVRSSELKFTPGQTITIEIHKQKHLAIYTNGVFHVQDGELAFAPGSSGHDDKFMEIFVRGGSAFRLFDNPEVEEEFQVLKK